jgi:multiple sugar transport system permease protein
MVEPRGRKEFRAWVWYIAACLIAACTIYPFLWMVATSLKPMPEIYARPLNLIPFGATLENYKQVLDTVPFFKFFKNSMILAVSGVVTNVFLGALAGYGFSKLHIKGKNIMFTILLSSMMIPGIVTMVPQFVVLRKFPLVGGNDLFGVGGKGFINSFWAIILPGAAGAYAVFFMRQFFATLPDDLGEAARIDGCGEFRIFWNVYFPLITPAAVTLGILTFQSGWNSFMWPLIVLNDADKHTIQIGLSLFKNNYVTNYGAMMAGTVFSSVPILILFAFAQRYFIEGIAFSGSKS